ncbi:MAG TPA: Rne/Rng family ribonuclease [Rhizomicrobium sp.]|jgi:ribonuclease E
MSKRMIIDSSHPEETRVVVLHGQKVEEFDFEAATKRPLKGNIYLAKVTRVEPSLQAAFVEYGGNRQGFLAFAEIHPDYYQIPVADRMALIAEQEAEARRQADEEDDNVESVDAASIPESDTPVDSADAIADGAERSALQDDLEEGALRPESAPQAPFESRRDSENAPDAMTEYPAEDEPGTMPGESATTAQSRLHTARPHHRWARKRHYKIQEVIKRRQIILVQVVKEERGNKGAAMTTYLSLAGRYCVLMPNTPRGGGISRKITSAEDRSRLKSAAQSLELPEGMGLIIRTAGENRSKAEIKRDYEYLLRMWDTIRELTLKSNAPACVYEEGDLIKRAIRDLYNKDVSEILVEGEEGYRNAKDFMRMLMPSHAKNVKPYKEPVPLFQRYQVESQLDAMFMPTVTLKSGGYVVINQTEALVAVDVNSGKATREHSIEDTAYKTNLEAAEEIARQLRLRDLAGLIVIDFIDMEDTRNDRNVEKRLRDCIKSDRARVQIGKISQFGLLEMSRQRLRAGVVAGSTIACPHCGGQGIVRSVESTALRLLRGIEEEAQRQRAAGVSVRAPTEVAVYALNQKRREISRMESEYGIAIQFEPKETMMAGTFEIDRIGLRSPEERAAAPTVIDAVATKDSGKPADAREPASDLHELPEPQQQGETQLTASASSRRRRRRGRGRERDRQPALVAELPPATPVMTGNDADTASREMPGNAVSSAHPPSDGACTEGPVSGQSASGKKRRRRHRGRRGSRSETETAVNDSGASREAPSIAPSATSAPFDPISESPVSRLLAPEVLPNRPSDPVWSLSTDELLASSGKEQAPEASPDDARGASSSSSASETQPAPQENTESPRKGWWQRPFRRSG